MFIEAFAIVTAMYALVSTVEMYRMSDQIANVAHRMNQQDVILDSIKRENQPQSSISSQPMIGQPVQISPPSINVNPMRYIYTDFSAHTPQTKA